MNSSKSIVIIYKLKEGANEPKLSLKENILGAMSNLSSSYPHTSYDIKVIPKDNLKQILIEYKQNKKKLPELIKENKELIKENQLLKEKLKDNKTIQQICKEGCDCIECLLNDNNSGGGDNNQVVVTSNTSSKIRVLELFKGSGSITNYYRDNKNVEVVSLDIKRKYNPTICCDILKFDYKQFKPGYFDIIFAGPECKIFSGLQYSWVGRILKDGSFKWKDKEELEEARYNNRMFINKTIEIIKYLKPRYYFIENPQYSAIWKYVEDTSFLENSVNVDYCRFGYDYRKMTKFLTNKKLKDCKCNCVNKKHKKRLGVSSKKWLDNMGRTEADKTTLKQRYSYPPKLLDYLLN